jgi:hypothetical protein
MGGWGCYRILLWKVRLITADHEPINQYYDVDVIIREVLLWMGRHPVSRRSVLPDRAPVKRP